MRGFFPFPRFCLALLACLVSFPGGGQAQEREGGWAFSPSVTANAADNGQHLWPDIALGSQGLVGVAWMDDHAPGGYHIFFAASSDGGATWSEPEKIDSRTTGAYSKFVQLAFTPRGIPIAVWEDDRGGAISVYLSRRDPDNGGTPWTPEVRVNTAGSPPSSSDFMNPSLAVLDEQRYFVAWTDWREGPFHQVYMRATPDGGATWSAESRISDEIGYQPVAGDPCLIPDPAPQTPGQEVLHCVMNDWRGNVPGGRYPDVFYSRSSNGGQTWSTGVRINDVTSYYQQTSSRALVLLHDGSLAAGWFSGDLSLSTYRCCVSTNQGVSWNPSVRVDDPSLGGTDTYSALASAGSTVFAAFGCYQGTWNLYFRPSYDGGRTWTEPVTRIDDDASGATTQNGVLAARSSTEVYAVWQDSRPGPGSWKTYTARGVRDITDLPEAEAERFAFGPPRWIASPNPARIGETVRFRPVGWAVDPADRESAACISITDVRGRVVRRLSMAVPGVSWDGRDEAGRPVASGMYWARFPEPSASSVRLVRIR